MRHTILFLSHTGIVGGAERSLLGLLESLDRERFAPVLAAPTEGRLLDEASALGVPVEGIPAVKAAYGRGLASLASGAASLASSAAALRSRLVRLRPHAIHANSLRAGLMARLAFRDLLAAGRKPGPTPTIWHVRDLVPPHPANRLIAAVGQTPSVHWVANSLAVARSLRALTTRPVTVVYNGIQTERFEGDRAAPWVAEPPEAFPVVGIVGQVIPWKGQLELLEAFLPLRERYPSAQLWIIGAPLFRAESQRYDTAIRERIAQLHLERCVRMFGAREDIPGAMARLDVLVLNSTAEPFGRVILEAQAAGVPVVATQAGGALELVSHERTGLLVPPGDSAALTAALERLAGDRTLRERLATAGRAQVRAGFTQVRMADRLAAVFEEVVRC